MPRHIDETKMRFTDPHLGKAQIDRDPAAFFFRQAVGINASQRFDESRFSMIDVAGGPDNYFHLLKKSRREIR